MSQQVWLMSHYDFLLVFLCIAHLMGFCLVVSLLKQFLEVLRNEYHPALFLPPIGTVAQKDGYWVAPPHIHHHLVSQSLVNHLFFESSLHRLYVCSNNENLYQFVLMVLLGNYFLVRIVLLLDYQGLKRQSLIFYP